MMDLGCTVQFKAPSSLIFSVGALAFRVTEDPRTHKPLSEENLLWLCNMYMLKCVTLKKREKRQKE